MVTNRHVLFGLFLLFLGQVVRRQKVIAEKEELAKEKARAADERKRAEKRKLLAKKKVRGVSMMHCVVFSRK